MKYAKTLVVTVNPTLCKLAVKKNNTTREIRTKTISLQDSL